MWPIMSTPNRGTLSIIGLYNWDDHIFDLLHLPSGVLRNDVVQNILMECGELETMYPDWEFMYRAINYWSYKELPTWEHIYEMTQLEYNPIENYDRMETELEGEAISQKRDRTENEIEGEAISQKRDRTENATEGENATENRLRASERSHSSDTSSDTTNIESIHSGSKNDTVSQNNTTNQMAGFNTDNLATQSGTAGNTFSKDETSGSSLLQNEQNINSSGSESELENASDHGNVFKNRNRQAFNSDQDDSNRSKNRQAYNSDQDDSERNKSRQLHAHGNIGVTTVAQMMAGELETYPKINIVNYITEAFKQRFCVLVY